MRKILSSIFLLTIFGLPVLAGNHVVSRFRLTGPVPLSRPLMIDSVNISGQRFSDDSLLCRPLTDTGARVFDAGQKLQGSKGLSVASLSFDMESTAYTRASLSVSGLKTSRIFIDGKESSGRDMALEPGHHHVEICTLLEDNVTVKPQVTLTADNDEALSVPDPGASRLYSLKDVLNGKRLWGVRLSDDGRYGIIGSYDTRDGGKVTSSWKVREMATGKVLHQSSESLCFFPGSDDLLMERMADNGNRQLVRVSLSDGIETVVASNMPKGDSWQMTPDGKSLILTHVNKGPTEDRDIYQIVEPDDRQPGWRDRSSLLRYDLLTGVVQPLTFGFHGVSLLDVSADSHYLLFMTSRSRLTARPTTLFSIWRMDLRTLKAECLVKDDGFVSSARFSPDGRHLVIMGSPECLGGVGKNVPAGRIPSMYDYQLYIYDIASGRVNPITKQFNPGVDMFTWAKSDGRIWFTALDRDYCHLYYCDPHTGAITQVPEPEDMVSTFAIAKDARQMLWYGEGASNSDRLYSLNTATGKSVLIEDLNKDKLKGVELGACEPWSFVNSRGDSISCRYYLPPHFDKTQHYPVIVNYYGGCSPTSRDFETRYPQHVWAAAGYVVLVVNPSGAVGFGQEFSSRHVNTAGKGVAEDIIEATQTFCRQHAYTDSLHVGCIGASYGGFMTQYLQTRTNLFAAAVSHAGISDHTSYWGEGYWGYSYSEVSMAGSYPWTRKDLFVDQSPLFNVEKIHTPLLFLHGNADHNVPIGESIQMFTALKLLGRPTAFVVVDGQDHHITDYGKRIKWHNTIMAWFQRYLKGDASWWNAIYKPVMQ
ncbi:S9 family peptidase [Hallella multisaccharivorax]|uniref:S9 family peptidase n=1 Tax=Hallella multisaccharivorax TaxID=310514 RepID=UPI00361078FB